MLPRGENHIFSYSQLTTVDECPYSFYLEKIETEEDGSPHPQQSNFFAEQGTLIHDLLEAWANGELAPDEMPAEYERQFPKVVVTSLPPYMKRDSMYQKGLDYCESFNGFPGFSVVSAEEKFIIDFPMDDGTTRKLTGRIDLILKDDKTGELVVVDHKSKSLKEFKKHEYEMYRQQYLYAMHVKEKYGHFPERLAFNLFKEKEWTEQPFDMEQFDDVQRWAIRQIRKIENNDMLDWLGCKEEPDFFCNEICSVRDYCPNGILKPQPKGRKKKE